MNILVASPSYPTSKTIDFVFVDQLCRAFADNGHHVTVIAPQSITKCLVRHIPIIKYHTFYKTEKGNEIELFRPHTITFGAGIVGKILNKLSNKVVEKAFKDVKRKPDVLYGHFWSSIYQLYPISKRFSIPLFGASGEENVGFYINKPKGFTNEVKNNILGVVSVSTKNQLECLELELVTKEKSVVIPNAVNQDIFKPLNKNKLRKKYGISNQAFVVAFTGQFVSRKGVLRLSEALEKLSDNNIKAIFMGKGDEEPSYKNCIFKGTVKHDLLPEYLSCADVFVLPTENEGCSNAIIEAMACGLPIVSSDLPFNQDILNLSNSILIDCHNIEQIAEAIRKLKDDEQLRLSLSEGALKMASSLSITKRAERIVDFMQSKITK